MILAMGALAQAPQQANSNEEKERLNAARKASRYSGLPIVGEFEAQHQGEPDSPRRLVREQRYSASNFPRKVEDPGRFVGGKEETTYLRFSDSVMVERTGEPRGMPVSVSTTIVVGTVISGKSFVTRDHTYVYTDYSIKIDQVLKPDPLANLIPGDLVVAAHEGGAIHFPSGHTTNFLTAGEGLPDVGSQYVLFLWRSIPTFPEYEIIFHSGYQLKNGHVYPLDDANSQYTDVEAGVFLDELQKAITTASQKGAGS
jgi:hypothetical protein